MFFAGKLRKYLKEELASLKGHHGKPGCIRASSDNMRSIRMDYGSHERTEDLHIFAPAGAILVSAPACPLWLT